MLTGTPLDLTPFGVLLSGIGWLYWLLAAAGLWWALRGSRPWKSKLLRALPVVLLFALLPLREGWHGYQARSKLNASMALFNERCKTAGEKITRTVENVDGVVWMRWREAGVNYGDQFKLDDPYGKDCREEGCILQLLRPIAGAAKYPESAKRHARGYRFVETVDPRDARRYRYTAALKSAATESKEEFTRHVQATGIGAESDGAYLALQREPIERFVARYGITWEDVSTREDREHWIAGSSLKAIDLQTNEAIASRTGYLIDTGQGSTGGFRSPWSWARTSAPRCPLVDVHAPEFATSVIQPTKQGE